MRLRSPAVLLLFGLGLALAVSAQQSSPQAPSSDAQAVAFLQNSLASLTGKVAISDVTLTGTATRIAGSDNETGTVTLKALATGESRMDLVLPGGNRSEVLAYSNGAPAGIWIAPDGVSHNMAAHNLWTTSAWFFPGFAQATAVATSGYFVSYVGQETRASAAVQHITACQQPAGLNAKTAALLQHLSQTEIYLDASTLLPIAITFNIHPDRDGGLDIPAEVDFSNYQSVGGAMIPYHIQRFVQNSLVLDLQLQDASLNTGLTPSAFSLQ